MIKKYKQFINEGVQNDINIEKYLDDTGLEINREFDDNCIEIDNIDTNIINNVKNIFGNKYWILSNADLKQMWIKDKPESIILTDYFKGKYLYHDSRLEHRNSILKNGLKTNSNLDSPLGYENLLFFYDMETFESYDPREDKDVWILDVSKHKLNWYENPNKNFDEAEGVYCLQEDVPSNYLKLKK